MSRNVWRAVCGNLVMLSDKVFCQLEKNPNPDITRRQPVRNLYVQTSLISMWIQKDKEADLLDEGTCPSSETLDCPSSQEKIILWISALDTLKNQLGWSC